MPPWHPPENDHAGSRLDERSDRQSTSQRHDGKNLTILTNHRVWPPIRLHDDIAVHYRVVGVAVRKRFAVGCDHPTHPDIRRHHPDRESRDTGLVTRFRDTAVGPNSHANTSRRAGISCVGIERLPGRGRLRANACVQCTSRAVGAVHPFGGDAATVAARTVAFVPQAPSDDRLRLFTRDELEVLLFLNSRLTLVEIADRLGVSRSTVKSHLVAMYRKAGVFSRAELLAILGIPSVDGRQDR